MSDALSLVGSLRVANVVYAAAAINDATRCESRLLLRASRLTGVG